ncbi:MAG: phage head closure protein [Clostridia bacterium]|nr:phage head closure protein [Clostridia bacterium]
MKNNYKPQTFKDGAVIIVKDKAKEGIIRPSNAKKMSDFIVVNDLDFEEKSIREQDFQFAESTGRTLSRKIKVHLVDGISSTMHAIIDGVIYSIFKADIDRHKREIFLYLEEERKLIDE